MAQVGPGPRISSDPTNTARLACAQSVERLVVGTVGYQSAVCQAVRPHTANVQASGRVGVFDAGENSFKRLFLEREREGGEREREP